jgi:hypothetical protein
MAASLVPIWSNEYFPTQNGPEYLLVVQMFKEYFNPAFNYSDYYDLNIRLIPNLSFNIIVYLLSFVFPLLVAYKISVSITIILLPLSVFYFIKSVDPKKLIFGFISFMYPYNFFQLKGYDCFCFSIPIFFFLFGYIIRHSNQLNIKNIILLSTLCFIVYLSHMFTFLLTIFVILTYIVIHNKNIKDIVKIIITFIPSCIFFVEYVFFIISTSTHEGTLIRYLSFYFIIQEFLLRFIYSYSKLEVLAFIIPFSVIGYLIIKRLLRLKAEYFSSNELLRYKLNRLLHNEIILLLSGVLCMLYFITPREVFGWSKFNIRLLPFIFIFMLVCAEPILKRATITLFLILTIISNICLYGLMSYHITKITCKMKDYLSGISVVEMNKSLLPVFLETYRIGQIQPLTRAFNYYNIFKGGATGKSIIRFQGRTFFHYKTSPEKMFPTFNYKSPETANMEQTKKSYDYVLFWGKDEEIFNLFENNGFVLLHSQGELRLYKNAK